MKPVSTSGPWQISVDDDDGLAAYPVDDWLEWVEGGPMSTPEPGRDAARAVVEVRKRAGGVLPRAVLGGEMRISRPDGRVAKVAQSRGMTLGTVKTYPIKLAQQILDGHMPPGESENNLFAKDWLATKIMNGVSEVATDPANDWVQQTGRAGTNFTRASNPVHYAVNGIHDGLKIRVIVEPGGEGIVTRFPTP